MQAFQAFLEPFRTSRKLRAAAVALLSIVVTAVLSREVIDPNTLINAIVALAAAYMGAVAWEDVSARQAAAKVEVASVQATQPTPPPVAIDANSVSIATPSVPPTQMPETAAERALRERGGPAGIVQ